jgi:hypothetical protein
VIEVQSEKEEDAFATIISDATITEISRQGEAKKIEGHYVSPQTALSLLCNHKKIAIVYLPDGELYYLCIDETAGE